MRRVSECVGVSSSRFRVTRSATSINNPPINKRATAAQRWPMVWLLVCFT